MGFFQCFQVIGLHTQRAILLLDIGGLKTY